MFTPAGSSGSSIDAYKNGSLVKAAIDRIDWKDGNLENPTGNNVAWYLDIAGIAQGRLTTESGAPISTSDRTSQGTIYYTPFVGNNIALYDGTRWKLYEFTERSLALTLTSGKNYDVFLYDNSGTLTLELSSAWTSDTARNDALTTQDGIYVKSGATTRRYLGTIRASGSNVTEDSATKRFIYNHDNKRWRTVVRKESAASWTYATATIRQANANSANQVEWVCGLAGETILSATIIESGVPSTYDAAYIGWGIDSTTAFTSPTGDQDIDNGGSSSFHKWIVPIDYQSAIGYHYAAWLEKAAGTATWTFNGISAGLYAYGITGKIFI